MLSVRWLGDMGGRPARQAWQFVTPKSPSTLAFALVIDGCDVQH